MKIKSILEKLRFWQKIGLGAPSNSMVDCIVIAFWLGEYSEPNFVQSLSRVITRLPLLYWNIFPPNWIICILQDTEKNEVSMRNLKKQIEEGGVAVDFPGKLRSGMQRGSFLVFLDKNGKLSEAPVGIATNEAMDRAMQATEGNRCVWPEL